ncbi:MAG TPA: N-acyl homoserine lactonase family protein [Solirubrobacteraceae bacterium]|nr:N-acyl homoserine lactonase family protein [Solirubrobacteraceae bacterium]
MNATGVELDVIVTAKVSMPYGYVYRAPGNPVKRILSGISPFGETLDAPCVAYAVRHPSAGTILIDTGMHRDARENPRRDFGLPLSLMFRGLRPAKEPFDEQLRALDIEPGSVERVVMTHLHLDHTSGMRLLPNAKFTASSVEWAATSGRFPAGKGYVPHHLPGISRMQLLDFERDGEPYATFEQTIDLLGDGTIRLIFTPGHTAGHLSVLLHLAGGGDALLIGDAAYTLRNIHEESLPMLTDDDAAARRSIAEIKAFALANPQTILVPSHDPDAWRALAG